MVVEETVFQDNYANLVNHGVTMITSKLNMKNCTIFFSEGFPETLDVLSVDTGFFNLFLTSNLTIQDHTTIKNLKALNQAVLSAISQSSVYIANDVFFLDNESHSSKGQTIGLSNTEQVVIQGAHFENNKYTNIKIELGSLKVIESNFTVGYNYHISGIDAEIELHNVHMYDSSAKLDQRIHGHGLNCIHCADVQIHNSIFENLSAEAGSVMYLEKLDDTRSSITNSVFKLNHAYEKAGVIYLDSPVGISMSNNTFKMNIASPEPINQDTIEAAEAWR